MYCLIKTQDKYIYSENKKFYELDGVMFNKIMKKFNKIKIKIFNKSIDTRLKINILCVNKLEDLNVLKNKSKGIYLIEFFDIAILLKLNENFCLNCLKKRYIETLPFTVKKFIDKNSVFIYNSIIKKINIFDFITRYRKLKFEGIVIYDKFKNKIYNLSENKMIKCNKHNMALYFDKIVLNDKIYNILETGYRILSNNSEINVGRFLPIIDVVYKTKIDVVNLPIYSSEIAMNYFESDFAFHGGKGYSKQQSYKSALGEAYERYCAKILGNEVTIFDSYENLKKFMIMSLIRLIY